MTGARTGSVAPYASRPANLRAVARELAVANILEGSVQKVGNQVLINVQLIDARTDDHVWAQAYTRTLDNVFGVEGEVAQQIARALHARLTGREQQALARKPTQNVQAWNAYLRALASGLGAGSTASDFRRTAGFYADAVKLDPTFALAWARLSEIDSRIYQMHFDRSKRLAAEAKQAADDALRLAPENGEAWLARGFYLARVESNYPDAIAALTKARTRLPNSGEVLAAFSDIEALAFIGFNTAVNVLGITMQARAHFFLLVLELAALAIFLAFAAHFVFVAKHGTGGWSVAPFFQPRHLNAGFVASATSIAVLSFLGFDAISTLAEETRNPRRTVGNTTVLVLLLLGVILMAQTYLAALAHPDYRSLDAQLGFFDIGRQVGGAWLYVLLLIVNVISSGIANALSAQLAIARILYSMGRDRALPGSGFLARVHPRLKTPINATLLVAVLSIVVALGVPEEALVKLVNFGALTAFMLLNVTVFVFFYIKRKQHRRVFSYLVFPGLGLAIVAFVWSGFDRTTFVFGGAWLLVGVVIGAFRYRNFKSFEPAP